MKLLIQILFFLLTWFVTNINATLEFAKVALPSYELAFSKTEKGKEESAVKIGVQNFARCGIEENYFSQKTFSWECYALEYTLCEGKDKEVQGAGNIPALLAKWDNLTIAEAKSLYTQLVKTELQGNKVVRNQAEILQDIQQRGITNPYNFAHPIEDFTLTKDVFFVRAYNQNKTGRWLISIDDVDDFTSVDDFIKKTALPVVDDYGNVLKPDKMVTVKVPSGTTIRKSVARPQDWGGQGHLPGGATQYEIINFNWQTMSNWYKDMGAISDFIK
jgi:hypothetical protein